MAHAHSAHRDVVNRPKRGAGHLRTIIDMIEEQRDCLDVSQQLHAVEKALTIAKRIYIQDHIDNCLEDAVGAVPRAARDSLSEFREITKYL